MSAEQYGHPVLDVYDLYRTARLNIKYLEARLRRLVRANLVLGVLLGLSACSSFTALWFFQTECGKHLIEVLSATTAIIAVLKPLLNLESKIRKKEAMLAGYRVLHHDLEKIVILIRQNRAYDAPLRQQFIGAVDRRGDLVKADRDIGANKRLLQRLYDEVNRELPVEGFYLPAEDQDGQRTETTFTA